MWKLWQKGCQHPILIFLLQGERGFDEEVVEVRQIGSEIGKASDKQKQENGLDQNLKAEIS